MDISAFLYWSSVVGVILIGTLVLLRQAKSLAQWFAVFTYSLSFWLICQYWVTGQGRLVWLWLGFGFLALEVVAPAFLAFAYLYAGYTHVSWRNLLLLALPLICFGPFSFSHYLLNPITSQSGFVFHFTAWYYAQSMFVLLYVLAGMGLLLNAYFRKKSHLQEEIKLFFVAFIPFLVAVIVTGAIYPNLGAIQFLRPLGALAMVATLGYAMAFKKLFDIRLIVARSMAYVFLLGSLSIGFTAIVFLSTNLIFRHRYLSDKSLQLLYTVVAIALALVFPVLKKFFDKITNRLFYQDSYDTQTFLDQLNNILVATFELQPLLHKSAEAIENNLKPSFTLFALKETETAPRRFIGTVKPHFTEDEIAFVSASTPKLKHKMIVTDMMDERFGGLQKVLRANDIAVMARLTSSAHEQGVGYLILGPKKSGNVYSSQDIKNIEIVANELVIAIQNALRFEEIQNFNVTLQAKVDEATRKLRHTNERLKELDETKDDFISMASHQLRTPLTSVKGYISMVLEGDAGKLNEQQKKLLEQSFISSQRMVYLIADLLNVSRLKTGKFLIEPAPVNLAEMVEQEMEQLKETAAAKGLTLTYDRPETFPTLMLDETKTRQVIMNFADNAIYYTPSGGHIKVELSETPASVELRVVDNGIGVPKAEQHHLFTKFYRAGNARKARPDGTGLGLFMAKKVVVAQGGAVIFESTEDKGSTFGFVFSKTKLAPRGYPDPVETARAVTPS